MSGPAAELSGPGTEAGAVRVGVVGLGYWGVNLARVFGQIRGWELAWCCDSDAAALESARSRGRGGGGDGGPRSTTRLDDLLEDSDLAAVAIATPVPTHAPLAEKVLAAGKHCFVEKPLARSTAEAERLTQLAADSGAVLMAGHLLAYHPAVEELKRLVSEGELGEVRYIHSRRLNLGKLRADENALWSLGAHDLSVVMELVDEPVAKVSARGHDYVRNGVDDVVFAHLAFADGVVAHMHVSWLDPHKERRFTVVGSQQMATFDDMSPDRKVVVYDKGFDLEKIGGEFVARSGAEYSPAIEMREPLQEELGHFLECVRGEATPRSGGAEGLRVVRVLEALQASLDSGGATVVPDAEKSPR